MQNKYERKTGDHLNAAVGEAMLQASTQHQLG